MSKPLIKTTPASIDLERMQALIAHPSHAFVPYPPQLVAHASDGPLAGLNFAVKDLFDLAGYPTGAGNPLVLAMSGPKAGTAPVVQRLLAAGACCLGKTHTDELAFSMNGKNAHFGMPINAAAPERIPGGSSSGSASAVAHGLVDFALGTDTGGSVRAPANHCGLYGIRPTHGRVSLEGAVALAPSFDTCGWFARDAETFLRVGQVLLGADTRPISKPRLLWPEDLWALVSKEVQAVLAGPCQQAFSVLQDGCPAQQVRVTQNDAPFTQEALYWAFRHIQGFEAWQVQGAFITRYAPPLGPGVAERFAWAASVSPEQCESGWQLRRAYRDWLAELLGEDGVLVLPTMPDIAPLASATDADLQDYREAALRLTMISGLTGFPQIHLPLASRLGAPLGLSLLGPAGSDLSLLELARMLARSSQQR